MVLYIVNWRRDTILAKGKGRVSDLESSFTFTVLCDSSQDAVRCLDYYFRSVFIKFNKHSLVLDDGVISLKRGTIDSRGFHPQYLLLKGMKEPMYLSDPCSNALRAGRIFGASISY